MSSLTIEGRQLDMVNEKKFTRCELAGNVDRLVRALSLPGGADLVALHVRDLLVRPAATNGGVLDSVGRGKDLSDAAEERAERKKSERGLHGCVMMLLIFNDYLIL